MKILSVVEAFCHGGAQTVLFDLVLALPEHEHRVIHFSRANGILAEPTFVEALHRSGVACVDTHWNSLSTDRARSELLGDFQPDIAIFHWWGKDPWMPWVQSRSHGAPAFVCVLHHAGIPVELGYDQYVAVSRNQLPQLNEVPAAHIRVIPNGVDLARFRAVESGNFSINDDFVAGRLSELRDGKIPLDWVRTLASFRIPRTRFVIAGGGELLQTLRQSAIDLSLEDVFSFPGYIPRAEVPSMLSSFSVFCYVTSSAEECCPLAILEAMAAGVPVIAEARGGIPEIVADGENGLLARSVAEVGSHLRRLRNDPALRKSLSRGARATAERFSLRRQVDAYRLLFNDLRQLRSH